MPKDRQLISLPWLRHLQLIPLAIFSLTACASQPTKAPAPQPTAKAAKKPQRPPRRLGFGGGGSAKGKAELTAAIKAAKAGDLDLAIKNCQAAAKKNPNLEQAYLLMGSSCAMKDDLACEHQAYKQGLEALPSSPALLKEMGFFMLRQGQYKPAVAKLERAHQMTGGKNPDYMADLAYAYRFVGRLDEGEQLAAQALKSKASCIQCALALGEVRLGKKDYPGAVKAFQTAVGIDGKSFDAQRSLAKAYFLSGDSGKAVELYENLLKQSPEDIRLLVQTAQVNGKSGNHKRAAELLEKADKLYPDQPQLLKMLAAEQKAAGNKKAAKATLKRLKALEKK